MMEASQGGARFLKSTRGRIVLLLRRAAQTVDDLAQTLGLTDNAVRAQLVALERDGLVRQGGLRRGVSKPAYAYELTPAATQLFPQVYGTLVHDLLDVLTERLPAQEMEAVLRETGRRMAQAVGVADRRLPLRERVEHGVAVLSQIGGLAELEEHQGNLTVQGYSCPLAAAVDGHPQTCALAETLLTEVIGAPVQERCERGSTPRCRFAVLAR